MPHKGSGHHSDMRNSLIGFFLALVATSLLASAWPAPAKDIADVQIVATAVNVAERALNLADQVAQAAPTADEVELAVWNSVKDTTFPAELEAYLAIYPNGIFAPLARIRLEAMLGATPEAQAAREREAQAAARNANRSWPGSKIQLTSGLFYIDDYVMETKGEAYYHRYTLGGSVEGRVTHQTLRNGMIWTNLATGVGGAANNINAMHGVGLKGSDIEKIVNGYGLAYVEFSVVQENWYCGMFFLEVDNTARIFGEVCISSQANSSQRAEFEDVYRLMVKGIDRKPA